MTRRLHDHTCDRPHCHTPTQTNLCENHTTLLESMLHRLPWLLDELDARIQRLDRINLGTIGRNRRPDEMNVMDFDAAETARKIRKQILDWFEQAALHLTGRTPPALNTVSTQSLARWLAHHTTAIATTPIANQLYTDIERIVGAETDTERRGQLINAINPPREQHFAGPCPTVLGHNPDGETIECGTTLYADVDETTITCPTCKQKINVEQNRRKAAKDRDYLTKAKILETLEEIGKPVTEERLNQWIKARRLRRRGWFHNGTVVADRVRQDDPAVYSFARAEKLHDRDRMLQRSAL